MAAQAGSCFVVSWLIFTRLLVVSCYIPTVFIFSVPTHFRKNNFSAPSNFYTKFNLLDYLFIYISICMFNISSKAVILREHVLCIHIDIFCLYTSIACEPSRAPCSSWCFEIRHTQ